MAVSAERVSADSIQVSWTPPNVAVIGYKIYYTTRVDGTRLEDWDNEETDQPTNTYVLTGLDRTSAYAIRVCI